MMNNAQLDLKLPAHDAIGRCPRLDTNAALLGLSCRVGQPRWRLCVVWHEHIAAAAAGFAQACQAMI
jgi:hypothetical protein